MIDIKKELVEVSKLSLDMYVAELDRSWEGTPFMLQGFLLENEADIEKLSRLCKHVYINRTKSIAHHFVAPAKVNVAVRREGAIIRIKNSSNIVSGKAINVNTDKKYTEKTSFIDILRDLKSYQAPQNMVQNSQDGTIYNMNYVSETTTPLAIAPTVTSEAEKSSIAEQLISDIGGFISGLFKRKKLSQSQSL